MLRNPLLLMLLTCAGTVACDGGTSLAPDDRRNSRGLTRLTWVSARPASAVLLAGQSVQLVVKPMNGFNVPTTSATSITYSTSDSAVAVADNMGKVAALGPGLATITVTASDGRSTQWAMVTLQVFSIPGAQGIVMLTEDGWHPSELEVDPGGTVAWLVPPGTMGPGYNKIWLYEPNGTFVDSVPLAEGIGSYRVGGTGILTYCSGGCWDPPDFGLVRIR